MAKNNNWIRAGNSTFTAEHSGSVGSVFLRLGIEGSLVRGTPPAESLCCVLDTLSAV